MKNLRFSNNAEAVLAAELPSNPNAPGAHIITVVGDGWSDKFSPLDGLYGVDDYLHPSQYPADAECQLVTLTHESNPGQFEVVAVVRHEFGTAAFDVKRNIEGAPGMSWPVGTLMQARVTAATLESFMQGSAADIPVVAGGRTEHPWRALLFIGHAPHPACVRPRRIFVRPQPRWRRRLCSRHLSVR